MEVTISPLWRRLDVPGHDACRLQRTDRGWTLEGVAVFADEAGPTSLRYQLICDAAWRTQDGHIHGWRGDASIAFNIERTDAGVWTLNGAEVPGLESYVDLDLGFTPATNLPQLRRIALDIGQSADVPVAWLDVFTGGLSALPQRYERRTESTYWYEAPTFEYEGLLEVDSTGFIVRYPNLWQAEVEHG